MVSFKEYPNYRKSELYREQYKKWKELALENSGYFPIFQMFKNEYILQEISGNALKLYIYLGLSSGNKSGETWVTIDTLSKYFDKSPRTISNGLEELLSLNLIERIQLNYNKPAHTFLKPYGYRAIMERNDDK